jgi:hypothetical protein
LALQQDFMKYFAKMPWKALPFQDERHITLPKRYRVR